MPILGKRRKTRLLNPKPKNKDSELEHLRKSMIKDYKSKGDLFEQFKQQQ